MKDLLLDLRRIFAPLFIGGGVAAYLLTRHIFNAPAADDYAVRVRRALEAVEREGLIFKSGDSFLFMGNTLAWIGQHRQSIIASTELVFMAVREAEKFISQSGAQKKAYPRDLIFVALTELGFVPRTGLLTAFIESLISSGIEAAVHLFHKRDAFTHRLS